MEYTKIHNCMKNIASAIILCLAYLHIPLILVNTVMMYNVLNHYSPLTVHMHIIIIAMIVCNKLKCNAAMDR